jgi:hypothetical protein
MLQLINFYVFSMNNSGIYQLNQIRSKDKINVSEIRLIDNQVTNLLTTGIYKIGEFNDAN